MTTIVIHGPPGSCKTATAVWSYGVPALKAGRTVVTNIRGFTVDKVKAIIPDIPESAKTINLPLTPEGYEQAARFFHDAPLGALILLDEVQKIYPASQRNSSVYDCTPPRELPESANGETISTVEHAFDQHRHLNWDIVCTCPNIAQVASFIRNVVEVAFRQRPMSGVLPFMTNRIKRVKHQAVSNGFVSTYVLGSETFKIDPRAFQCYQSTATGVIKQSEDKFSLRSQPKLILGLGALVIALLFFGFSSASKQSDSSEIKTVPNDDPVLNFKITSPRDRYGLANGSDKLPTKADNFIIKYIDRIKYYVGFVTVNNFRIFYFEGDDVKLTSVDLASFNVSIKMLSPEFVQLEYGDNRWVFTTPHDRYDETKLITNTNRFGLFKTDEKNQF